MHLHHIYYIIYIRLKTSAIIPVKSFSKAKTRLNLPQIQKEDLCLKMFDEVLRTISSCKSIDKIARDHITSAGYGKFFDHGLGHSLGLEIHENPRFSKVSTDNLGTNYVMTVEPGIYVKDVGGVRIEDDVVVKEEGYQVLNKTPKDFYVIS